MNVQLTVRMSSEMKQAVDRAARSLRRKPSDVVRMALQAFLDVPTAPGRPPIERVRGLIGSLESGVPDLADRHREYILESLKHGK